jgi:hypothetical protein
MDFFFQSIMQRLRQRRHGSILTPINSSNLNKEALRIIKKKFAKTLDKLLSDMTQAPCRFICANRFAGEFNIPGLIASKLLGRIRSIICTT